MRFGFTPDEYAELTRTQLLLLQKADEERTVQLGETLRRAIEVAIANACRKKGRKALALFEKIRKRGPQMSHMDAVRKMHGIESVMGGTNG